MNQEINAESLLKRIRWELEEARRKHPVFAQDYAQAVDVMKSEQLEWEAQAILAQNPDGKTNATRMERALEESMDVIMVHLRFQLGEYVMEQCGNDKRTGNGKS